MKNWSKECNGLGVDFADGEDVSVSFYTPNPSRDWNQMENRSGTPRTIKQLLTTVHAFGGYVESVSVRTGLGNRLVLIVLIAWSLNHEGGSRPCFKCELGISPT